MCSALVQKLIQEYTPGKHVKYYLTKKEASVFIFSLFKELNCSLSKKEAGTIVKDCLNEEDQFTLSEFTNLVQKYIPAGI